MSRYTGPRLRIVRRLGALPGLTQKTTKKRKGPPGQQKEKESKKKDLKKNKYRVRLIEKQKLRYNYGISERQLLNYVRKSRKAEGSAGEVLLKLLEMRLDNIVFRLGMAPTILAARQLVNHRHIIVNNNCIDIPSYQCKPEDIIEVKALKTSRKLIENNIEKTDLDKLPQFLAFDKKKLTGFVNSFVNRDLINLKIQELLVVEYYSRKV
jgi:small subunit ribosomal protein S4